MAALCHSEWSHLRPMYVDQLTADLVEWRLGGNN